jgi:hypothetical protein
MIKIQNFWASITYISHHSPSLLVFETCSNRYFTRKLILTFYMCTQKICHLMSTHTSRPITHPITMIFFHNIVVVVFLFLLVAVDVVHPARTASTINKQNPVFDSQNGSSSSSSTSTSRELLSSSNSDGGSSHNKKPKKTNKAIANAINNISTKKEKKTNNKVKKAKKKTVDEDSKKPTDKLAKSKTTTHQLRVMT